MKFNNFPRSHNSPCKKWIRATSFGVAYWEEKICWEVGLMSWKKILKSHRYNHNHNHQHDNVIQWNDSAGKEAFVNAKKRYWLQINGKPCVVRLPNPDMFIDEIDWSSEVGDDEAKILEEILDVVEASRKEKETKEKENTIMCIYNFDMTACQNQINPTGWEVGGELFDPKNRVLTGTVVGD